VLSVCVLRYGKAKDIHSNIKAYTEFFLSSSPPSTLSSLFSHNTKIVQESKSSVSRSAVVARLSVSQSAIRQIGYY